MNLHSMLRWVVLLATALSIAACATPTPPPPTLAALPTETSLSKPTATLTPTFTAVPPSDTLEPTATPTPTLTATPAPTATTVPPTHTPVPTKMATPGPTRTKSPASVPPAAVSSKPSTLQKSNGQAISTAEAMVGLLDQMASGGGAELCAPLIEKHQSIRAAPTYDMNGQPNEIQQAYGLYRQGIELIDTRSGAILACGQGGGAMGGIELGLVRQTVSRAIDLFGRARDLISLAPGVSTLSPLENAIVRLLRSVEGINGIVNGIISSRRYGGGQTQFSGDDPACAQAVAYHNAIVPFTMDPAGQPPPVQAAYQLYQEAANIYEVEISNFPRTCVSGEVTFSSTSLGNLHGKLVGIIDKLNQALNALKQ
jgi:hypothetical protein